MTATTVNDQHNNKRPRFWKSRKHALRIDMTPMVDLGFLLITFFIFTSTLSEPKAMNLILPKEGGPPTPTKQSGALTILPSGDDKIYYYEGQLKTNALPHTSLKGIREIIISKKSTTAADDLFVIIKPARTSNYRSVVDVLDEMMISRIKRFALVKITAEEEVLLK